MEWYHDLFLFLFVPSVVVVAFLLSYRGDTKSYKIVKETNRLGETCFEIWFEYQSIQGTHGWRLEKTFDTEEAAVRFIDQQQKTREVIREGKLWK